MEAEQLPAMCGICSSTACSCYAGSRGSQLGSWCLGGLGTRQPAEVGAAAVAAAAVAAVLLRSPAACWRATDLLFAVAV